MNKWKDVVMATIEAMDDKQRNRILNTKKEYVRVKCSVFNASMVVKVQCTDKIRGIRDNSGYSYIVDADYLKICVRNYINNK